jgi:hypothetical protein
VGGSSRVGANRAKARAIERNDLRIAWRSLPIDLRRGLCKRASKADATGESYYDALVQEEPDRSRPCRPCGVTHV